MTIKHTSRFVLSLFSAFLLLSCGTVTQYKVKQQVGIDQIFADHKMGQPVQVPEIDALYTLTEDQKADFLNTINNVKLRHLSNSDKIEKYLRDKLNYFNFHSDTATAAETMQHNSGNCLSLALLTKALTRLTTVGIRYELARTPPVFLRENGLQVASQHIRTVIYDKTTKTTKQFINNNLKRTIDYYSTIGTRKLRSVKKDEFYAMYYSNKAAEAMVNGEFTTAYWFAKKSLSVKPDFLAGINVLGVIYQATGDDEMAEKTLLYGLSLGGDQLELLYNYHKLLIATGRSGEAEVVSLKIDQYDDPDPFKWLDLANAELADKNYRLALKYYQLAAQKADYMHQPFAGMAKAHYHLGQTGKAVKAIKQAMANSHQNRMTSIYQAKFQQMQKKAIN